MRQSVLAVSAGLTIFLVASDLLAAPVSVLPGDTLGIDFRFTAPFTRTPTSFGVQVTPTAPLSPPNSFEATTALYNGTQKLAEYTGGSGPSFGWGLFSQTHALCLSNPSSPLCANFSSITNRTIDGKLTSTFTDSSSTLTFDPNKPNSVWVYAGTPTTRTDATITSVTVNDSSVYTIPKNFDKSYSLPVRIGCGGYLGFQWCPGYDYSFDGEALTISLSIGLRGDSVSSSLIKLWEDGIEGLWGSDRFGHRYEILEGPNAYPIYFDVSFISGANPFADLYVNVVNGTGRSSTRTWYTDMSDSYGNDFLDEMAAHEFGHYLGLIDEYAPVGSRCDTTKPLSDPVNARCDGLMGDLRKPPVARYYEQIVKNFSQATGRVAVLGNAPFLPNYEQSFSDYVGPFGEDDIETVPEPGTLPLLMAGLAAWLFRRSGRKKSTP